MDRFISPDFKKDNKQKLKFTQKFYKSLTDMAAVYIKEIKNLNCLIDDIYMSSVNLSEQNKYNETIIEKIIP